MSFVNKKKLLDDILSKNISRVQMIEQIESLFRDFDESLFLEKISKISISFWKISPELINKLNNPRTVRFLPIKKDLYIQGLYEHKVKDNSSRVGIDGTISSIKLLIGVGSKVFVSPYPTIIEGEIMYKVYV